jgi:alpha-amylase
LKAFTTEAKKRGIRVLLDLVANHCGSKHKWFSDPNPAVRKDHWFPWSDYDKRWGSPWPSFKNNTSLKIGSTWRKDPYNYRRNHSNSKKTSFFYGAFDHHMPDLNYNNPKAREEVITEFTNIMKFWIEKTGVAGYRCDAVRYMVETGPGVGQRDQPLTHAVWKEFRKRLAKVSPSAVLVAEAPTETYDQMIQYYGNGDEFHGAFHFKYQGTLMGILKSGRRAESFFSELHAIQKRLPRGTQDVLFLANHDHFAGDRIATQLQGNIPKIKSAGSLYILLSGIPTIYYGEEIAMYGGGSDRGIRGPMEWANAENQLRDPNSVLNHYRRLLKLRHHYKALSIGESIHIQTHFNGHWDHYHSSFPFIGLLRKSDKEFIIVIHGLKDDANSLHLNLKGLGIQENSEVHCLMGQYSFGPYDRVTNQNMGFYPIKNQYGWTTKVLFVGNIDKYRDQNGKFLTYENAI